MSSVRSADGTDIAYERTGSGPPLVLVHGSLNDASAWGAVMPGLAARFSVYAITRRGRGASGPCKEHQIEREFEDVAAVIDAAGEPVDLLGHSYGAHCALGAALMRRERVKHLVLYEPPSPRQAAGVPEMFETLPAAEAITRFLEDRVGMPPAQVAMLKETPFWANFVGFAPTMPAEIRALVAYDFQPASFAPLTMPALFLVGSETRELLGEVMRDLDAHMPQAEWSTLEGQGHGAIVTAPKPFTDAVLGFLAR